jgi:ribonuclease HI
MARMTTDLPLVTIYTDGSASPNPGPGGWGAILLSGEHRKTLSGSEIQTTNNRMELTAAVYALEALTRPCRVEFHTDSQYMRQGITSWIHNWMRNGWRTAAKKPVENKELWIRLYDATQKHQIEWVWVKGHATNALNNEVDQLANVARKERH